MSLMSRFREHNPTPVVNPMHALEYIIREGRQSVSPELAQRILAEARYDGQRPIRSHHVALLADFMRRKRWTPGSQICFGSLNGRLSLVNGQHRMMAVIESGETIEFQVLIVPVSTGEELAALYYRFDVAQRQRSLAEVLNPTGIADSHGLSKSMMKSVYGAVGLITNHFQRPNYQQDPIKARSIDARLDAARSWWPFGAEYEKLVNEAPAETKKRLLNQGIVSVALVTLKYQPEKARPFWSGVAADDGLRRGDPRHTFLSDLRSRLFNQGTIEGSVRAPSVAWNAWYEGRQIKIIKVYADQPVRILGTPFDGRRR